MERGEPGNMNCDDFVEQILYEIVGGADLPLPSIDDCDLNCDKIEENIQSNENNVISKPKSKRRSNLTEFPEFQSTKRKNESAKRELTSIVNQLGKFDKQLNSKDDPTRASISFIATFNTFKSNRVNTFKYPPDAAIKTNLLDYDTTMTAVKVAVKEAMKDFIPRKEADGTVTSSNELTTDAFLTQTNTIATFTSKNLCGENSCTFGKKISNPVWVKCGHRFDEGKSCNYWVHAPCIGFPNLKENDVQMLDSWCCPDHTEIQMKRK